MGTCEKSVMTFLGLASVKLFVIGMISKLWWSMPGLEIMVKDQYLFTVNRSFMHSILYKRHIDLVQKIKQIF